MCKVNSPHSLLFKKIRNKSTPTNIGRQISLRLWKRARLVDQIWKEKNLQLNMSKFFQQEDRIPSFYGRWDLWMGSTQNIFPCSMWHCGTVALHCTACLSSAILIQSIGRDVLRPCLLTLWQSRHLPRHLPQTHQNPMKGLASGLWPYLDWGWYQIKINM